MQPILAEFCGRWGCTWQEGLFNLILVGIFSKGGWIFLALLAGVIFLVGLFFVGGFLTVYEFFVGSDISTGSIDQRIDRLKKFHQQGKQVLPKVRVLGRTARIANKAIKDYRQEENVVNQANSQQQEPLESKENAVSNEADSVETQPQPQRIQTAAKFLGRTLRNIAND